MPSIDYLMQGFKLYVTNEEIANYEIVGPFELMVTLKNGTKYFYDDIKKSYRYLPPDSMALTNEEIAIEFRIRFNAIMERQWVTQTELSKLTGIPQPLISKYANGQSLPGFIHLDRICKALGCSADDFRYL